MGTPANAVLGTPGVHTVNIIDDDSAPTVQFISATQDFQKMPEQLLSPRKSPLCRVYR